MPDVQASLQNLTDSSRFGLVERYEGFQAGGGGMVKRQAITLEAATCTWDDGALRVDAEATGGRVEAISEALDLPVDWEAMDRLSAKVAAGDQPVTVDLVVIGARSRLIESKSLAANQEAELAIDLIDLPLSAGNRSLYQPTGVRFVVRWGEDADRSAATCEGRPGEPLHYEKTDGGPRQIFVKTLTLYEGAPDRDRTCVDRFGQRRNGDWPGKVTDEAELRAMAEAEGKSLNAMTPPPDRDEYGGWIADNAPGFESSGYFRVDRDESGRWWFVTPSGHPFWSMGTTGVRLFDRSPIEGREYLFEAFPPKEGEFARAWYPEGVGYYTWNILRKYGSIDAWITRVAKRFHTWGFNTIGNWSDPVMEEQKLVPHVRTFRTRGDMVPRLNRSFPDVFDPAWESYLGEIVEKEVEPQKDNRWLLGWFVDNEWGWRNPKLLEAPDDAVMRDHWLKHLREHYDSLDAFNADFQTNFTDWSHARAITCEQLPDEANGRDRSGKVAAVVQGFEAVYADRYFGTINRLLKQADPNHMYLGCRFTKMPPHEGIVAAAGRHTDIMSVNCYSWRPEHDIFNTWFEYGGKPVLIGEHHAPLAGERQLPPLYPAFEPEQRFDYYTGYLKRMASMPFALGCHWFQHADQPITGRHMDGENQCVGFVDLSDQPHQELVSAVREVSANVYQWHMASTERD